MGTTAETRGSVRRYGRHDMAIMRLDSKRAVAEAQRALADKEARRQREVARLYRERERRTVHALIVQVCLCAVAFAVILWLAGNGCGDVQAEPVDVVRAQQLAKAMVDWQPTRARDADKLREYAGLFVRACGRMQAPLPNAERCPELLAAIAFRESSWRENAIGSRGEVGLMQLHGLALHGQPPTRALDPVLNVRLGARWLDYAGRLCNQWRGKESHTERALSAYAGLGCVESRQARLALRYADEIRAEVAE